MGGKGGKEGKGGAVGVIKPVKAVHYVNQFFGGIGGEEQAGLGVSLQQGPVASGRALQQALGDQGEVTATIICGDNHFSENSAEALAEIEKHLKAEKPDVLFAGPAFAAGRYGLACGQVCRLGEKLGIPSVTGLHPDNPAVHGARKDVTIVPTGETPADMADVLAAMTRLVLKRRRGIAQDLVAGKVDGANRRRISGSARSPGRGSRRRCCCFPPPGYCRSRRW